MSLRRFDLVNTDVKIEDLIRDYVRSFFLINVDGAIRPCYIRDLGPGGISLSILQQDRAYKDLITTFDKVELYFLEPRAGYYNIPYVTPFVSRNHRRQYRCGYNDRTYDVGGLMFSTFMNVLGSCKNVKNKGLDLGNPYVSQVALLEAYTKPTYFTVQECIEQIRNGNRLQAAPSLYFCLIAGRFEEIYVMYRDTYVGQIVENKVVLDKFVEEDLTDVAKDQGIL